MSKLNFILVGNEHSKKHFLVSRMHNGNAQFDESAPFPVRVDEEKAECFVHFVHDTIPFSQRKFSYLKGDIIILVYSALDKTGEYDVIQHWIPELHSLSSRLPTILVLTQTDEIDEITRESMCQRGQKIVNENSCVSFHAVPTSDPQASQLAQRLFGDAVLTCLLKKRQRHVLFKKSSRKKNRFSLFLRKKKTAHDGFGASLNNMDTGDDVGSGFSYSWRGEPIVYLMELLAGGNSLHFRNDSQRDMTANLLIEDVISSATEVIKKLCLFSHFENIAKNAIECDNLNFYLEADYFMNNSDSKSKKGGRQYKKDASRIIREYLQADSPKEIYSSKEVYENVSLKFKLLSPNMFAVAQALTLSHLSDFFREKVLNSYLAKELTNKLKEIGPHFKDNVTDPSGGERLERMLSRSYHGSTLIELLHSKSNDKHFIPHFSSESDSQKLSQITIKNLILFLSFIGVVTKEKSQENILFWLDVEDFRSFDFGTRLPNETIEAYNNRVKELWVTRANHIFNTYVKQSAPLLVNLPSTMFKSITKDVANLQKADYKDVNLKAKHVFDSAQKEILLLMRRDAWSRFFADPAYRIKCEAATKLFDFTDFVDPEDSKNKEKFRSRFEIDPTEQLVRSARCILDKKMLLHGELTLSNKHLCFYSSIFGFKTAISYLWTDIKKITIAKSTEKKPKSQNENEYMIIDTKDSSLILKEIEADLKSLYYTMSKCRQRNTVTHSKTKTHGSLTNVDDDEDGIMTNDDWDSLQAGAEPVKYTKGDIIVTEGSSADYIYQIAVGSCRVEKQSPQGAVVVGRCYADEFIGEMSFIERGTVSATVIAETSNVVTYSISRGFVDNLLVANPGLSARFYKFLSTLIVTRINAKTEISDPNKEELVQKSFSISQSNFNLKFEFINQNLQIISEWKVRIEENIPIYGQLFLSETFISFYSQILGSEKIFVISFNDISSILLESSILVITNKSTNSQIKINCESNEEIKKMIEKQINISEEKKLIFEGINTSNSNNNLNWSYFLNSVELKHYSKDESVIKLDEKSGFLYQIVKGSVRLTEDSKKNRQLGIGDIFGEMAFMEGKVSKISVNANEDGTEIYRVEKTFVDSLLSGHPLLVGAFYKYISLFLCKKLRS
eukprot:c21680_g1_i1.p1 GENE.c21680_g1_i1~~c21680_g1_i1.p1  ORF type:complete len:1127 (+),score=413.70 c21680_g1_i1:40-3420(+)